MYRQSLIRTWQKTKINRILKTRRFNLIDQLSGNVFSKINKTPQKVLEIGCADGKDFVNFILNRNDINITGIDLIDYGLRGRNFDMVIGDAEQLHFPDKHFDFVVSFGVLEHIQPIEKLAGVIREIDRVGKKYIVMVPAINSIIEAHTGEFIWQLRDHNRKNPYAQLNYFSDEAWLQFLGFSGASIMRFPYMPLLKNDLFIYKTND